MSWTRERYYWIGTYHAIRFWFFDLEFLKEFKFYALQRHCTENSKQIFPEIKLGTRTRSLVSGNTLIWIFWQCGAYCQINLSKNHWLEMSGQIFSPKFVDVNVRIWFYLYKGKSLRQSEEIWEIEFWGRLTSSQRGLNPNTSCVNVGGTYSCMVLFRDQLSALPKLTRTGNSGLRTP